MRVAGSSTCLGSIHQQRHAGKVQLDALRRPALPLTGSGWLLVLLLAVIEIVLPIIGLVALVVAVALRGGPLWTLLHLVVVDEANRRDGGGRRAVRGR